MRKCLADRSQRRGFGFNADPRNRNIGPEQTAPFSVLNLIKRGRTRYCLLYGLKNGPLFRRQLGILLKSRLGPLCRVDSLRVGRVPTTRIRVILVLTRGSKFLSDKY